MDGGDIPRMKAELVGEVIAANVVAKFACRNPECCAERAQAIIEKLETLMANAKEKHEHGQSLGFTNQAL